MRNIESKIIQLRDQTWETARDSLESGETRIFRVLTDIAEKLTMLIAQSDKNDLEQQKTKGIIPIFAQYKDEKYNAELNLSKINGGRGKCIWMGNKWWTASGSAIEIKKNSINPPNHSETDGWKNFWKYFDKLDNKEFPIDRLRENNG